MSLNFVSSDILRLTIMYKVLCRSEITDLATQTIVVCLVHYWGLVFFKYVLHVIILVLLVSVSLCN